MVVKNVLDGDVQDTVEVAAPAETTVLVGQNYFDPADRYKQHKGYQVDKFISSFEFLNQKVVASHSALAVYCCVCVLLLQLTRTARVALPPQVYGCQVVITNVSSARQALDVLLQIPQGAIPVSNGFVLSSRQVTLSPYSTEKIEYQFYFPALGEFDHYPVHVAAEEALVAFARATRLSVVNRPSVVDTTSWEYVSQQGTLDRVLTYLETENLEAVSARATAVGVIRVMELAECAGEPVQGVLAFEGCSSVLAHHCGTALPHDVQRRSVVLQPAAL